MLLLQDLGGERGKEGEGEGGGGEKAGGRGGGGAF